MRRIYHILSIFVLLVGLSACAKAQPTWQEQYDLGVRYLSEGNYEEAIIAFTAAIEIDPKRAEAYVGRGDAYVASGETEENLTAAQADYETAIELDETSADAYLGLADVYIRRGKYDKVKEILKVGSSICEDGEELQSELEKINELSKPLNSYGAIEFTARNDFVAYMDMKPEQKEFVNQIISALENNDQSAMETALNQRPVDLFSGYFELFAQSGRYKVRMLFYSGGTQMEAEIREENGMGYFSFIGYGHTTGGEPTYAWSYTTCPCVDWQPDGPYRKYEEVHYLDSNDIGYTDVTGTAAQGIAKAETVTVTTLYRGELQEPQIYVNEFENEVHSVLTEPSICRTDAEAIWW